MMSPCDQGPLGREWTRFTFPCTSIYVKSPLVVALWELVVVLLSSSLSWGLKCGRVLSTASKISHNTGLVGILITCGGKRRREAEV